MCSPQEQTFFQVNDSHEAAIKMTEDSVSRRPVATNKSYFYFTTAFLSVCLVFALATIMILIVQKTVSNFHLFSLVSFSFCCQKEVSCNQKKSVSFLLKSYKLGREGVGNEGDRNKLDGTIFPPGIKFISYAPLILYKKDRNISCSGV